MSLDNLELLLIEQLQDIYYAEQHLVKALPKMAKAANDPELKTAFTNHLAETTEHVTRLEQVFEALGVAPKAKKCPAIDGLIQEAAEMMEEEGAPAVLDAGLIASAQRVEHYEMAAYGNVKTFALILGHEEIAALLETTLQQEHVANKTLSKISIETVLPAALTAEGELESEAATADQVGTAGKKRAKSPAQKKEQMS
ncbi:MAG: ferritin-like domain-containing protein [Gemmatimonadales bacterium]